LACFGFCSKSPLLHKTILPGWMKPFFFFFRKNSGQEKKLVGGPGFGGPSKWEKAPVPQKKGKRANPEKFGKLGAVKKKKKPTPQTWGGNRRGKKMGRFFVFGWVF